MENHHDTWNTVQDLCGFVSNQEMFAIKSCAQRSGAFNILRTRSVDSLDGRFFTSHFGICKSVGIKKKENKKRNAMVKIGTIIGSGHNNIEYELLILILKIFCLALRSHGTQRTPWYW